MGENKKKGVQKGTFNTPDPRAMSIKIPVGTKRISLFPFSLSVFFSICLFLFIALLRGGARSLSLSIERHWGGEVSLLEALLHSE